MVLRISIGVHRGTFHMFMAGATHRELIVAGPAATNTVAAEGTATAGEIVHEPDHGRGHSPKGAGARPAARPTSCDRPPARPRPSPSRPPSSTASIWPATCPRRSASTCSKGDVEAEHRIATVAFLHFDGTDAIVEENGPADLAERLHVVVRRVQAAAEDNGVTFLGTDIDHDGGKIILVSGVPRRAGEDEQRMLLTLRQITSERASPRPAHRRQHRPGVRRRRGHGVPSDLHRDGGHGEPGRPPDGQGRARTGTGHRRGAGPIVQYGSKPRRCRHSCQGQATAGDRLSSAPPTGNGITTSNGFP